MQWRLTQLAAAGSPAHHPPQLAVFPRAFPSSPSKATLHFTLDVLGERTPLHQRHSSQVTLLDLQV